MTRHRPLLALLLSGATLIGCGYALVGRSSTLPEDIKSVFVQALENRTGRAQVDQILTRALADEFVTRQRFKLVAAKSEADAILTGTVTAFRVRPVTFGGAGRAKEYEVLITARMEFKRPDASEPIWKQEAYQFRDSYELNVSEVDFFDRENEKLEDVAEKFAETVIIDLLEGF